MIALTQPEKEQVVEILSRRANEIASFKDDVNARLGPNNELYALPGSVEMALSREINRLRKLAEKLNPERAEDEDEE